MTNGFEIPEEKNSQYAKFDEIALCHFKTSLQVLSISLNDRQIQQFVDYYYLLVTWNSFMNLTSITDPREVGTKHFVDSLSLFFSFPDLALNEVSLIDVGTGAGFPGIPLKIAFPKLKITLLDSLKKRVDFLSEVINKLKLSDIYVIHGRAEDYAKDKRFRESYDFCVSRAVSNMTTLAEYCLPFVKLEGNFICYKSDKAREEYESAKSAIHILGGQLCDLREFVLPESDIKRVFYIIKKVKSTPSKYPRKAGIPQKEPLF